MPATGFGELQGGWERAGLLGVAVMTVSVFSFHRQTPSEVFVFVVIAHFNPELFNAESKCSSQRKAQFLSSRRYTIVAPGIISNKRRQIAMGSYFSSSEPFTVGDILQALLHAL